MNNPFDYTPDGECEEAFRKLIAKLETLKGSDDPKDVNFLRELDAGKMLGVLIATDSCGLRHTLYAFSGQLGDGGLYHPGFVGPVFDYLQPGGYFKTKEMEISRQNIDISLFEEGQFSKIRSEYERAKGKFEAEVSEYKERCRLSKIARNAKRESGITDKDEIAAMIRQSQFEKAELHRLKKRAAERLEPLLAAMNEAQSHIDTLKERRRMDSEALQQWLFSNFTLLNARGESRTLSEIFAETPLKIPPSGAGECCAPKLLQAAYLRGWKPIAIAEYWYGHAKSGEIRIDGAYYPACRGKCLPVLGWMLQGLDVYPPLESGCGQPVVRDPEIIYENRWFCVVDKPSGMLSVPGKGNAVSVQQWLEEKYGSGRSVRMAHRLDQDTSGLLIATFGNDTLKVMQSLFATRKVKKTYVAELVGDYRSLGISRCGHIDLPLSPDWLDRPRQRVDLECGKEAVTYYEFTGAEGGRSRVEFRPVTGRTHQLRIHAASEMGLGMPIAGDRLYGRNIGNGQRRLHLHAEKLEFTFPTDGNHYCFESPAPF
ncbi:ribosomal large subunit pseudouridine synthase A [Muribaculaceae bacterium]|nr:ribosomal large subunit pseudouridine synthase A [Muribaculaceae bacterium]